METIIREIRQAYLNNENLSKYNSFKKSNPKFFDMLTRKDMDDDMLTNLLHVYSNMQSQDKGDIEFGELTAKKYINHLKK
tara:strand:- start:575 stop:814 length:240 start_codon:yes stop_codon:yes gene_type:complete